MLDALSALDSPPIPRPWPGQDPWPLRQLLGVEPQLRPVFHRDGTLFGHEATLRPQGSFWRCRPWRRPGLASGGPALFLDLSLLGEGWRHLEEPALADRARRIVVCVPGAAVAEGGATLAIRLGDLRSIGYRLALDGVRPGGSLAGFSTVAPAVVCLSGRDLSTLEPGTTGWRRAAGFIWFCRAEGAIVWSRQTPDSPGKALALGCDLV